MEHMNYVLIWGAFCIASIILFGDKIFGFLKDKSVPVLVGIVTLGVIVLAGHDLYERAKESDSKATLFLQEAQQISVEPKSWITNQLSNVSHISLGGTLVLIDKQINKLKEAAEQTDDKEKIMLYGDAIDALETQSECLRQLKSPARCLK